MYRSWYVYDEIGDPTNVQSYYQVTVGHNCLCGNQICAIYAKIGKDLHPAEPLSSNILLYVTNALASGAIQPQNPFYEKKFVYLKSKL